MKIYVTFSRRNPGFLNRIAEPLVRGIRTAFPENEVLTHDMSVLDPDDAYGSFEEMQPTVAGSDLMVWLASDITGRTQAEALNRLQLGKPILICTEVGENDLYSWIVDWLEGSSFGHLRCTPAVLFSRYNDLSDIIGYIRAWSRGIPAVRRAVAA